jgi:hypothetical protein
MDKYIASSVEAYANTNHYSRAHRWWWLATIYANQRWTEHEGPDYDTVRREGLKRIKRDGEGYLIDLIAEFSAREVRLTTNGGWEVWLDREGWDTVPWIEDEEYR